MRAGDLFGQTLRDAPADAQVPSHKLLIRGAFIRQVAAGIYAWLPLGHRTLMNVAQIVREEMNRQGAIELLMPMLHPAELWKQSGRWETVDVMYRLKDRSERELCLAPTHEEVITFLASTELPSYKDLPSIPYHIQWKFRDEPRARGGLLRGREFLMKDSYSFDADEDGLKASYERMYEAYRRTYERCGLNALPIEAQAGMMGGSVNHEFIQPADAGEDTFVTCDACDYAANTEAAVSRAREPYDFGDAVLEKVHTPGKITVGEVATFLGVEPRRLAKALVYEHEGALVCALIPGDRELNEYKLAHAVGGGDVRMLTDFEASGIVKGFAGPVGLSGVRLIADRSLEGARGLVTGANEIDHHLTGVAAGRDFTPDGWADLIVAAEGDACARCGGALRIARGIEVGHIFQLGTRYSVSMDATFSDASGQRRPFIMGCYGLGVSRVLAAVVEAHHDDRGIAWPRSVAPFQVGILLLAKDDAAREVATALHDAIGEGAVLDDRDVSPGVKFADADLIGYPLQVVVGKTYAASGKLEAKIRATGERSEIGASAEEVLSALEACP